MDERHSEITTGIDTEIKKPVAVNDKLRDAPNRFLENPELIKKIDIKKLPKHIALIMDGNRRWAIERGKHKIEGHHAGVKALRDVVECALDLNEIAGDDHKIQYMTFYAFSKENWNRSIFEIEGLMKIFEQAAIEELMNLHRRNIKIRIIGSVEDLPNSLVDRLNEMVELTANNTGLGMHFAISYSGRWEIVKTARRLANAVLDGNLAPDDIDENVFQKYLLTWDAPDPDLLVRTSGEMRISNFLLWQLAYTEIFVTDVNWPDFDHIQLINAIECFQSRDRRYGAD
ncbi:MAG: polyprenyl diphosphate synthase [bacterium]